MVRSPRSFLSLFVAVMLVISPKLGTFFSRNFWGFYRRQAGFRLGVAARKS